MRADPVCIVGVGHLCELNLSTNDFWDTVNWGWDHSRSRGVSPTESARETDETSQARTQRAATQHEIYPAAALELKGSQSTGFDAKFKKYGRRESLLSTSLKIISVL